MRAVLVFILNDLVFSDGLVTVIFQNLACLMIVKIMIKHFFSYPYQWSSSQNESILQCFVFKILPTLKTFIWASENFMKLYYFHPLPHLVWFRIQVSQKLTHKSNYSHLKQLIFLSTQFDKIAVYKNYLDTVFCNIYGTMLRIMISSWYWRDNIVWVKTIFTL